MGYGLRETGSVARFVRVALVMKMVRDFKELDVWKKGMALAKDVYKVTAGFPREEVYGLTSQLRRAVVGISSNPVGISGELYC